MVEEVERLQPVFPLESLRDLKLLENIQVEVVHAFSEERIASHGRGVRQACALNPVNVIWRYTGERQGVRIAEARRAGAGARSRRDDGAGVDGRIRVANVRTVIRQTVVVAVETVSDGIRRA